MTDRIPFNKPFMTGNELSNIIEAHRKGMLAGDGPFTQRCHEWLEHRVGCDKALLTHSCTAALEMSALLLDIKPGDEVIMPSYTFVSTANAFVLRGGVPVFVDIRQDTLNLDEKLIEEAISDRTRAIVPVHYAGVSCEMDSILAIARKHNLYVIEDAAQGMLASYNGKPLGSLGDMGAYSFHETKNVISGEGGALLVNNQTFAQRAEIIREKGTDRSRYFRGEVDKYTWQDLGSSFLPGELIAAFLWAQFEASTKITDDRINSWNYYHQALESHESMGRIRRPVVPEECSHNAHMYYILLSHDIDRRNLLDTFMKNNIVSVFHYIPLHSSPAGKRFGRASGELKVTDDSSSRLVRLPVWGGLTESDQDRVLDVLSSVIE